MQVRSYTKAENKLNNPGLIELFDLSGEMLSRRKRVMLDTLPQVQSRYSEFQSTNPNFIGSRWIDLNTSFFSYSLIESQSHILLAASIWVLDHVEVDKVCKILKEYFQNRLIRNNGEEDSLLREIFTEESLNSILSFVSSAFNEWKAKKPSKYAYAKDALYISTDSYDEEKANSHWVVPKSVRTVPAGSVIKVNNEI